MRTQFRQVGLDWLPLLGRTDAELRAFFARRDRFVRPSFCNTQWSQKRERQPNDNGAKDPETFPVR